MAGSDNVIAKYLFILIIKKFENGLIFVEVKAYTVPMFWLTLFPVYKVRQKSSPLKFFAVFLATVWNFNMEFYRFIYSNILHLTDK